nr:hypothetical protein HK105_003434 [Polyrhizophydium stewartii]
MLSIDRTIKPLLNPQSSSPVSAVNAMVQLFLSLPELNQELPVDSPDASIASFVRLAQAVHLDPDSLLEPAEVIGMLGWLTDLLSLNESEGLLPKIDTLVQGLLDSVLLKTRFGRRFDYTLVHGDNGAGLSVAAAVAGVRAPGEASTHAMVQFDMSAYDQANTVTLLDLLNRHFGRSPPTLFFGGSNPALMQQINRPLSDFSVRPATQFTILPHFLLMMFQRPALDPPAPQARYHATSVELPLEIDLGFLLDPTAPLPIQHGHRSDNRSPTFYRLHGFLTQANAHFLTYTRVRGGHTWFKCDDSAINSVDLGTRVASRGVMVAIYRLQD